MSSPASPPASEPEPTLPLAPALPTPMALRAELEDLVVRELLGPAGGPLEEVDKSRVSDRNLVGTHPNLWQLNSSS